jgi:hypothetical protein
MAALVTAYAPSQTDTATPQEQSPRRRIIGFPQYPPASDADPSVTHDIEVSVPTRLKVRRAAARIAISDDASSTQKVHVAVGKSMSLGIRTELRVYPVGTSRPAKPRTIGLSGLSESHGSAASDTSGVAYHLNTSDGGIPRAGTKYVIEENYAIFQTATPPQHMWMPDRKTDTLGDHAARDFSLDCLTVVSTARADPAVKGGVYLTLKKYGG